MAKHWVCKRAIAHIGEAMECLGGSGYVEESGLPRLYREAPVNSIWEGSGNVLCLDVLRALRKEPECADAVAAELGLAHGGSQHLDAFSAEVVNELRQPVEDAAVGRRLVSRLARALQASLLVRHAPAAVADAFVASRIRGEDHGEFGTLPPGLDLAAIVARATPGE